jgi:hypothetical protein
MSRWLQSRAVSCRVGVASLSLCRRVASPSSHWCCRRAASHCRRVGVASSRRCVVVTSTSRWLCSRVVSLSLSRRVTSPPSRRLRAALPSSRRLVCVARHLTLRHRRVDFPLLASKSRRLTVAAPRLRRVGSTSASRWHRVKVSSRRPSVGFVDASSRCRLTVAL